LQWLEKVTQREALLLAKLVLGEPLPDGTFRQWKSRGRIAPVDEGGKLYDMEDVLLLAAGRIRHKREIAAGTVVRQKRLRNPAPRPPVPKGPESSRWVGDDVGYHGVHKRLRTTRGRPDRCDHCGTLDAGLLYEWALNWEGDPTTTVDPTNGCDYSVDLDDYVRLCSSCHRRFDAWHRRVEAWGA
jgi:hypothetical protein